VQISFHDKSPIYRQLAERLREMILEGVYRNGDALPSVRQIASEHQINPITVSKAFQILVDDDLVEKKRGLGMYVGEGAREQLLEDERRIFIDSELPSFQDRAQRLGFSLKDLLQEVS
jgi:GntR family transcriptional regulator